MSKELNDFIEDLDIYVLELNNGVLVIAEVVDIVEKVLHLNYPLHIQKDKGLSPYGTSIGLGMPLTSVKSYLEATAAWKQEYFKYNLIRKIVSSGGLSEKELFEFQLVLDEEPKPFKIDARFEKELEGFYRNQKVPLNN